MQVPDTKVAEIIDGELFVSPRPASPHAYAATYLGADVPHLWFVEPLQEMLEIYRLEAGRWVVLGTHAGDDAVRAEPFEAVELEPRRWWMPRGPE